MVYTGSDTDLDFGQKYADKYEFITNNSLDTLKRFGNLLVSADKFSAVFQRIAKEKFNKKLGNITFGKPKELDEHTSKLYGYCLSELMIELTKLTGFQAFTFRVLEAKTVEEKDCVIIERSNSELPFVSNSNYCVACGVEIPEGDQVCKGCLSGESPLKN